MKVKVEPLAEDQNPEHDNILAEMQAAESIGALIGDAPTLPTNGRYSIEPIKLKTPGRFRVALLTAEQEIVFSDELRPADARQRARFIAGAAEKLADLDTDDLERDLLRLAHAPAVNAPDSPPAAPADGEAPTGELRVESASIGGGRFRVSIYNGELIHVDELRLGSEKQRAVYVDSFLARFPVLTAYRAEIEAKLMRLGNAPPPAPTFQNEIEVSRLVRPELFHAHEVSGVLIPCPVIRGREPAGTWVQYLRWADGTRERRQLEPYIDVPNGQRLWFSSSPADPLPTMRAGWSESARRDWLNGAAAPDPCDVFKRLCQRFNYYLELPEESAAADLATLSLWTLFTYVFPPWSAVPFLKIGGTLGSGKTRVFEVLGALIFRPLKSSNMTAPCLFRTLHERGGTLLLDEAERLRDKTPDAGEIRSVLLSGYKRGSPMRRMERQGESFQQVEFDVFGPKALAGIASLPEALASRCIGLTMLRAAPDSPKPSRRIDETAQEFSRLRDDLHALAMEHGRDWLALADRADVCPTGISGRAAELWQPLLALAAWLEERGTEGLLSIMQKHAQESMDSAQASAAPEAEELILRLLADRVRAGTQDETRPSDLLASAKAAAPSMFEKWSPKGVSEALKRYNVRTAKMDGAKVYGRVDERAMRRIQTAYGMDLGYVP